MHLWAKYPPTPHPTMLRLPVKGSWLTVISPCMWSCSCSKNRRCNAAQELLFSVLCLNVRASLDCFFFFFLPSHSKNQYLFRLPNPRVCSKEKRNQSPPVFRVVFKLSQVPPAREGGKERVRVHSPLWNSRVLQGGVKTSRVLMSLLVVGRSSAGEDHGGEQGEGCAVNGVSSQSEAEPLRYLSQEVGPRHVFKHPTCRWN